MAASSLGSIWPLFELVVRTPRLELRYPSDEDLAELAGLTGNIHDPAERPFIEPWNQAPDGERERNTLQFHWANRASFAPAAWVLSLVAVVDGQVVGEQSVRATEFATTRTVDTGSWLHRPRHGQGFGTEMRCAVLHLAFAGLGAERAETSCYEGSHASRRVTEKLGYEQTEEGIEDHDGTARRWWGYAIDHRHWEQQRRSDIELLGAEACRQLLGA